MTFSLTIETDNDAFSEDPAAEIARILSDVGAQLRDWGSGTASIRDINGNTVGAWTLTYEEPDDRPRCPRCGEIGYEDPDECSFCADQAPDDEDHEHVWGLLHLSRLTGTAHYPCTVPGCRVISLDGDDEDDDDDEDGEDGEMDSVGDHTEPAERWI